MSKPVKLASLPKDRALALARSGGRTILGDIDAVTHVYTDLMRYWIDGNIPKAFGQSDDEFGDLLQQIENEFNRGVDEAVASAISADKHEATIERIDKNLTVQAWLAFKLQGIVAFMVEALPDDRQGDLPIRCTLMHLRDDMMHLAENLMDLVQEAKHG